MILVTGGTGTAGGEVISQLASTGRPFAMVRSPEKAAALKVTGVQIVAGDLAKPETLPAALRTSTVFLLAHRFPIKSSWKETWSSRPRPPGFDILSNSRQ